MNECDHQDGEAPMPRRSIFTCCLTVLSVVAVLGSASAASSTRSSATTVHRHHHSTPNYYNYAGAPGPDCYLPSDGCDNEHSIVN
jgi:hypothetical protein